MMQPDDPVHGQYERLPYPARDPNDERERLIRTWIDDLAMLNHYCFAGRQSFRDHFRVLVAGGGTGDATIFLAEQLRRTNAQVVHVDTSQAALDIARSRAQIAGLTNITWVNDTLLAVPGLGFGEFDYINCAGVLHHLEDPDAGLRALLKVLKADGALGVMVYAKYGRTGVYQMQTLLRLINGDRTDDGGRIRNARDVLDCVPPTNWFKRGEELFADHKVGGDAGIYDLLLHARDRAYTVGELYDWFHDLHGLHIQLTARYRGRSAYLPEAVVAPKQPAFLAHTRQMPERCQHEIAELLGGALTMHIFFATRSAEVRAPYGDPAYVPGLYNGVMASQLAALIRQHQGQPFMVDDAHTGITGLLVPGRYGEHIINCIDGKRDFASIFELVRAKPELRAAATADSELFADFRPLYDFLTAVDRLWLRHRSVEPVGREVI